MSVRVSEIGLDSKDKIHADQVVKNIISAVKELLDNSIDAKATAIGITLTDYGATKVEVSDNGLGMSIDDIAKLGLRGATSKIREDEEDITKISFLGFRVELLGRRAVRTVQSLSRLQSHFKDS